MYATASDPQGDLGSRRMSVAHDSPSGALEVAGRRRAGAKARRERRPRLRPSTRAPSRRSTSARISGSAVGSQLRPRARSRSPRQGVLGRLRRRPAALPRRCVHRHAHARGADGARRLPVPRPRFPPGWIRHLELHCWRDDVASAGKTDARRALAGLRADCPSLEALEVADDLGWAGAGRADLVVEAHFADEQPPKRFSPIRRGLPSASSSPRSPCPPAARRSSTASRLASVRRIRCVTRAVHSYFVTAATASIACAYAVTVQKPLGGGPIGELHVEDPVVVARQTLHAVADRDALDALEHLELAAPRRVPAVAPRRRASSAQTNIATCLTWPRRVGASPS